MNSIVKNTSFLMLIQLSGYVVPLIELPYLARILSPRVLGQILFVQAVALTLSFFIEYGFNLRASRDFSQNIAHDEKKSKLIGLVFQAKLILLSLTLAVFFSIYFSIDIFAEKIPTEYLLPLVCSMIGFGFSSFWYFQATERMGVAASWELACRILYLISLVLFVKHQDDAIYVLYFQSFFTLLCSSGELYLLFSREKYHFSSWSLVWLEIKQGWHVFIYKSSSSITASMSIWMLGFVSSTAAVAYYAGAEKIVRAIVGLSQPVILASYPLFSRLSLSDKKLSHELVTKYCIVTAILLMPMIIILFLLSSFIVNLFLGAGFYQSSIVLNLLLIIIPLRILNTIIGHLSLLAAKKDELVARVALFASVLCVALGASLSYFLAEVGMAYAVIVTELVVFVFYTKAFLK